MPSLSTLLTDHALHTKAEGETKPRFAAGLTTAVFPTARAGVDLPPEPAGLRPGPSLAPCTLPAGGKQGDGDSAEGQMDQKPTLDEGDAPFRMDEAGERVAPVPWASREPASKLRVPWTGSRAGAD